MKPFSRLNLKRKCKILVKVMDVMQLYFYQSLIPESVQCISAHEPYYVTFSFTGGVALPLLLFFFQPSAINFELLAANKFNKLSTTRFLRPPSFLSAVLLGGLGGLTINYQLLTIN